MTGDKAGRRRRRRSRKDVMGNGQESLLKGDVAAAAGRELQKICSGKSHLTSSQDDTDRNEDRHHAELFGLIP